MKHQANGKKVANVAKRANKVLRAAVIGVGPMGTYHVQNLAAIKGVKLVAVSDLNAELGGARAAEFGVKFYPNHLDMLREERLDMVSVVVPSRFHVQVGLDVIKQGVNALIEKPIATTDEDARALISAADKHGVKLMVGHGERFNPVIRELKHLIDKGVFGDLIMISATRVSPPTGRIQDNVLIDLGVHDADIISYLFGSYPIGISANGGDVHRVDTDDHAEILLRFSGKRTGLVVVNWVTPARIRKMVVTGSKGYAEVDLLEQTIDMVEAPAASASDWEDLVKKFSHPRYVSKPVPGVGTQPLRLQLESFLNSIRNDTTPVTTGEDGRRALAMALAAEADIKNWATK